MASEKLSNVIGAPFAEHVLTQLNLRAAHNSTTDRSNDEILFLANKMSWVKLTSSVRVQAGSNNDTPTFISEYYKKLGLNYANADDLAKNWVLQAGTSKADGASIDLRYGVGADGAYGLGGTEELGYRPMPGLTSVTVDTKGTLGSLREATIQFKVQNMNQLNIIEALYFRLGYSMLLEWGHNQFYTNVNVQSGGGTFTTNTYGINPFEDGLRKEKVQQLIAQRSYKLSGNYDGMLGVVTNFHWSFNQTGGYDCTVKLIGLGAIMDTLRINSSYVMPSTILQAYKSEQETIKAGEEAAARTKAANAEEEKRKAQGTNDKLPDTPTNPQEIYTKIYTTDIGTANPEPGQDTFLANNALPVAYNVDPINQALNTVYDYYYKAGTGGKSGIAFITELNTKRTGLFLSPIPGLRSTWTLIPAENYPEVILSRGLLNETAVRAEQLAGTGIDKKIINFEISENIKKNIDLKDKNLLGSNPFVRAFDYYLYNYPIISGYSTIANAFYFNGFSIDPDEPVYSQFEGNLTPTPIPLTVAFQQEAYVTDPETKKKVLNAFDTVITYTPAPYLGSDRKAEDALTRPTRREIITVIEDWFLNDRKIQITSIERTTDVILDNKDKIYLLNIPKNSVAVKGTFKVKVPKKAIITLTILFTNTALIETVLALPVPGSTPQNATQNADAGNTGGTDNSSTPVQTDPGYRFASALHAMLAAVKSRVEYKMTSDQSDVVEEKLSDVTKTIYEGTILEKLFDTPVDETTSEFNLIQYALKGFNSNLMVNAKNDPTLFNNIKSVNFPDLSTAYGIRWAIQSDTNQLNYPSYIKLGYLLSFLNAMCLIYDSTQDTNKHPYVYLDFNPYTNFCLTMPQHMSIDPFTCMIPFQGTQLDYLKLFPPDIKPNPDPNSTTIFNENLNEVSWYLPKFKASSNAYQGSTMEILLNIDFLINTLNARTTSSPDHTVDLKGFLDDIMTGINKATGNLNSFRVAYRDDSNTVIIKDDQFVPPMEQEKGDNGWIMNVQASPTNYGVPNGLNVPKYGQLPIFGKYSLVRDMRFETEMSTKLSSIIAISGQSSTKSVNSTDHSSFSWLNTNFMDTYRPIISDNSNINSKLNNNKVTDKEKQTQEDQANSAATAFNQHVMNIYRGGPLSQKEVSAATNYYINGIAQVKSRDGITLAAPFIPANINLTIDGIGGIIMGNAFTIPEDRLPLSLRGQGGADRNTKVGFVVVGLTHTLDNNQWLTKIRGQMIKLRDNLDYGTTQHIKQLQLTFPIVTNTITPANVAIPIGASRTNVVNAVKALNTTAGIKALMLAQIGVEGYYPDTLAYRTNNPGNVGNTGKAERHFPTLADGVQAMLGVTNNAVQKRGYYIKVVTLLDYINVYAPPSDPKNKPNEYVSNILGYFKKIGLTQFTANSTINQIAAYNGAINFV